MMKKHNDLGIYIHIPFCESKCYYCDFNSSVENDEIINKYLLYLEKEVCLWEDFLCKKTIDTIFIGGGTPSILTSKQISSLENIFSKFKLSNNLEFTVEANPNSINLSKIKAFKKLGVNRISLGAQSTNETILKKIGRIHGNMDLLKAVDCIKESSIENFNLDFMMALPGESIDDIDKNFNFIEKLNPKHISYYSLILEEGTPLFNKYKTAKNDFPDENLDRKMYHYICRRLKNLNFEQYEISNFSKPEYRCRHNLKYWLLQDYLSFGLSAHSNIGNKRFWNYGDFETYFNSIDKNLKPIENFENLSIKDRINEFVMMGLRLNDGVDFEKFEKKFGIDFKSYYKDEIEKSVSLFWCKLNSNNLYLTSKGRDLSNQVELIFIK